MNLFQSSFRPPAWLLAFSLAALVAGCGSDDDAAPVTTVPPVVDPVGGVCDVANPACVNLGTAGNYVIFALAGVTNSPTSAIIGNVALNATGGGMTGFSETADASNTFSTSAQVTGKLYNTDHTVPTPGELTAAMNATGAAIGIADAMTATTVNLPVGGNLTGQNLAPGVYSWNTGVSVDGGSAVTLTGGPTDVWVFQIDGDITMNPGSRVALAGGALSKNVFWRTTGVAALNTTAHLAGIVLSDTSVTLANGATVDGRLYATTAVTLISNTVTRPAP